MKEKKLGWDFIVLELMAFFVEGTKDSIVNKPL